VTVKLQMHDTRRFVETRLQNLSALWEGEPRIAREEIAKHVQKITLKPMLRSYVATGTWNWLGILEHAATMVVPGAGYARNCHKPSCPSIWPRSPRGLFDQPSAIISRWGKRRKSPIGRKTSDSVRLQRQIRPA
jgi:hypothetical protein